MEYQDDLKMIGDGLAAALAHRAELARALAQLDAAGMYPGDPVEVWESRDGGAARYLRLQFHKNPDGKTYQGPDGKRQVYIGADPARIAEARRLAENRRRWEVANRAARNLDSWIDGRRRQLASLAGECKRWQAFDLGQAAPAAVATSNPNGRP